MPHQAGAGPFPLPRLGGPRSSRSRSRRVQQRHRRAVAATNMANKAITALNVLHSSTPTHTTPIMHSSNSIATSSLRAMAHVQSCAKRFVSRLAPTFQDRFSRDDDPSLAAADPAANLRQYDITPPALPLSADQVSLPAQGDFVQLLDLLPPDLARRYAKPNPALFRPVEERRPAQRAFLVQSNNDYIRIIRRLHELTMVTFTTTPKVINGVFATPKTNGQRFVVDGRRVNSVFAPSPKVELPTPDLLANLQVPAGQELFVAKVDLDNFYHRIKVPVWMHPYFALPRVRAADVGQGHVFGDDTMIHPCCTTLPMGWSHSAFLGQELHEHVLDTETSLASSDRITKHNDLRVDRARHQCYIDDLNMFSLDRAELCRLQTEYVTACRRVGLTVKMSKVVLPSSDGVECIGMEVHGRHLTCGLSPRKMNKLLRRTEAVLQHGSVSGQHLSSLVGLWSWAFLARRPAFSIFNAVYRYIETAGSRIFHLWITVRRELNLAVALAPLLFSSLSSPWNRHSIATDASSTGLGVVATSLPVHTKDSMAREQPPTPSPTSPLPRHLDHRLTGHRWRTIVSSAWRWPEHINILEARALLTGIRWTVSSPSGFRCRLFSLCDSLVVVHAARKGRSSSYPLLRVLRQVAAISLACGIQLYINWIATEVNPADAPSRLASRPSSEWVRDLTEEGIEPNPGPRNQNFLLQAAFQKSTLQRYQPAVAGFSDWLSLQGEDPDTVEDLDRALVDYFHHLYLLHDGRNRSLAEACKAGVEMYLPAVKKRLHGAQLALRGWRRLRPPVSHPPLTWDLAVLIACDIARTGRARHAIGVLLAFDSYLRLGELTNLRREDVADSGDIRLGVPTHKVALRLAKTKTGTNQWAEVFSPVVQKLLRLVLQGTPAGQRLFPFSPSSFRYHFKAACQRRGLSRDFVPHSLRHGGATRDFLAGVPLEEVLRRGRWASTKSARHYIQSGRAILLTLQTPDKTLTDAALVARDVLLSMNFALSQMH